MSAADAIAAIDALIARVDAATKASVSDGKNLIDVGAKALAPVKTGALRRSIIPTPTVPAGLHAYTARVGPTTVYGRQRELGGHIYPVRAKALRFLGKDGAVVYAMHVYQHPEPYLKPAAEAVRARFRAVVVKRMAAAILG